jgi:hypothetical protein
MHSQCGGQEAVEGAQEVAGGTQVVEVEAPRGAVEAEVGAVNPQPVHPGAPTVEKITLPSAVWRCTATFREERGLAGGMGIVSGCVLTASSPQMQNGQGRQHSSSQVVAAVIDTQEEEEATGSQAPQGVGTARIVHPHPTLPVLGGQPPLVIGADTGVRRPQDETTTQVEEAGVVAVVEVAAARAASLVVVVVAEVAAARAASQVAGLAALTKGGALVATLQGMGSRNPRMKVPRPTVIIIITITAVVVVVVVAVVVAGRPRDTMGEAG